MAQFLKHFVQDLQQDIKIRQCGTIVFNGDNKSNVITVELYNGQEPYAGGGTVSGACICPDGATVPLTNGTLSGNTVTITLTGDCFAIPGQIGIGVQVIVAGEGSTEEEIALNTIKTTVLKAIYNVELLETDTVVDPGSRITLSVADLIDDIDTALASIPADLTQLMAGVAQTFNSNTAYKAGQYVWYNGELYRFTTDHAAGSWNENHATKSSVGDYTLLITDPHQLVWSVGYQIRSASPGDLVPNAKYITLSEPMFVRAGSTFQPIADGDTVYQTNYAKYSKNADGTFSYISYSGVSANKRVIDEDCWIRIGIRVASTSPTVPDADESFLDHVTVSLFGALINDEVAELKHAVESVSVATVEETMAYLGIT